MKWENEGNRTWFAHSLAPQCVGSRSTVNPPIGARFHPHGCGVRSKSERLGTVSAWRCTIVLLWHSLSPWIFDLTKTKLVSDLYSTGQIALTFPGWRKHSRGAGGVKGGCAAAHAVETLDTALSASAHNPNIRGMSIILSNRSVPSVLGFPGISHDALIAIRFARSLVRTLFALHSLSIRAILTDK